MRVRLCLQVWKGGGGAQIGWRVSMSVTAGIVTRVREMTSLYDNVFPGILNSQCSPATNMVFSCFGVSKARPSRLLTPSFGGFYRLPPSPPPAAPRVAFVEPLFYRQNFHKGGSRVAVKKLLPHRHHS